MTAPVRTAWRVRATRPVQAYREALVAGLAALALDLTDAQVQTLLGYLHQLERWNRVYNLTAIRDPAQMLSHHLLDCLAAIAPLRREVARLGYSGIRIADVGSGGGLPGVVIAALHPDWDIFCIDAVAKKAGFVRQVASELGLKRLHAIHGRAEAQSALSAHVVTARAFSSLGDLVQVSRGMKHPEGVWMAMKGQVPDAEIAKLPAGVGVFHVEPLTVPSLEAQRCLVWLRST